MTTALLSPVSHTAGARSPRPLLLIDAALCAALGFPAAVASGAVADLLGPDVSTTAVRVVGALLVVCAIDLLLLSRSPWAIPATLAAGMGNIAWELAAIGLVVSGAFSVVGGTVALITAAGNGLLGLLQLRVVRASRAGRSAATAT